MSAKNFFLFKLFSVGALQGSGMSIGTKYVCCWTTVRYWENIGQVFNLQDKVE